MAYADFDYYQQHYHGTLIAGEQDFARAELWAERYIDRVTCGRIVADDVSERVRQCACALADVFYERESRGAMVSENNDGYSVSYAETDEVGGRRLYAVARMFLPDELLYRGVTADDDE